jgi:Glycine zipper 2TM domain
VLKQFSLAAAVATTALTALPSSAEAYGRYRHRHHTTRIFVGIAPTYYGGYYDPYYARGYYGRGYYAPGYYNRGYYGRGYHGRGYYDGYYGRPRYRCDRRHGDGTAGAIVGGAVGALLGSEAGRGGYRYRRGGGSTTGAIVGGAAGALIGSEIARGC